jgi:hypothetical protein
MLGCTTPERFSGDFVFLGEQGKITQRRGGRGGARRVSESWSRRSWEGVANALVFAKDRRCAQVEGIVRPQRHPFCGLKTGTTKCDYCFLGCEAGAEAGGFAGVELDCGVVCGVEDGVVAGAGVVLD